MDRTHFRGWEAIVVRNAAAELVVVPALTRIMRFSLRDAGAGAAAAGNEGTNMRGPFWNHPDLSPRLRPDADGWTNYGGDKAWPAPQAAWRAVTGRAWPPPRGFDALPSTATRRADGVELVSALDPDYGIRVRRTIHLEPRDASMTIETTYEKVRGPRIGVAVWTITQLVSPERLFVLLPPEARSRSRGMPYLSLLPDAPREVKVEEDLLALSRDVTAKTMISSAGSVLLWVGDGPDLLIEDRTPEGANADQSARAPNDRARSQIYTAPGAPDDQGAYVELELLGRLDELAARQSSRARVRYTLIARTERDAAAEARKVLVSRRPSTPTTAPLGTTPAPSATPWPPPASPPPIQ